MERLEERPDGRLSYQMRRPAPDGSTHLVVTPLALLKKLAALIPPPRFIMSACMAHLVQEKGAAVSHFERSIAIDHPGRTRRLAASRR